MARKGDMPDYVRRGAPKPRHCRHVPGRASLLRGHADELCGEGRQKVGGRAEEYGGGVRCRLL